MAQQRVRSITRDHTPQFGFGSIKIYPDECLGTGAYGAVCKAMCDELPCAAKVLHSALFQFNDPGMPAMMRRFQQECEMLGRIRHPCIVQYLGTVQDPESHRPILLMELMDESLTRFLEHSTTPLAYHLQVNLSYDVALALAYLHSNGVVHRDLSSNNVLITAGSRAKVTDFGMLKLLEQNTRMTPLTKCPGTVAYMPPEALSDEPEYTDKLDCFSFGVLMIQIITRNFPEPTKAMVTVCDPKYPTGRVLVPVPEVERRKKDVDLVDDSHPIKPISLGCLKDTEIERPSAQDICHQLVRLRQGEWYSESVQQALHREEKYQRFKDGEEEHQRLKQEYQLLKDEQCRLKAELDDLKTSKDREIEELRQQLEDKVKVTVSTKSKQIIKKLQWKEKIKVKCKWAMGRGAACFHGFVAYFNPVVTTSVYQYDYHSKQWSELPYCPINNFALVIVNDLLTTVGGLNSNKLFCFSGQRWVEKFPPMSTKRSCSAVVCTGHYLVVAGGQDEHNQDLATVEVMNTKTLQWFTAASLPRGVYSTSMTACGDDLYLLGDGTTNVYKCSLQALLQSCHKRASISQQPSIWSRITDLPVSHSTAVTLCGQLVSVGGKDDKIIVDSVYYYDPATSTWKTVGQLPLREYCPLVTTLPGDKLIIVSGSGYVTIDVACAIVS